MILDFSTPLDCYRDKMTTQIVIPSGIEKLVLDRCSKKTFAQAQA